MWVKNLGEIFKLLLIVSVVFAVVSCGIFFLRLSSDMKQITASTLKTEAAIQTTLAPLPATLQQTTAAMTDLDRTIQIAGGTLNIARDTLKKEQSTLEAANTATVKSMTDLDMLVINLDGSQKDVVKGVAQTLAAVQATTSSVIPVMEQTRANLATLQPAIVEVNALLKNTTSTMSHVDGATADIQTEIHKFVYPPPRPWYDKYIVDPIKLGARMLTIPLR